MEVVLLAASTGTLKVTDESVAKIDDTNKKLNILNTYKDSVYAGDLLNILDFQGDNTDADVIEIVTPFGGSVVDKDTLIKAGMKVNYVQQGDTVTTTTYTIAFVDSLS